MSMLNIFRKLIGTADRQPQGKEGTELITHSFLGALTPNGSLPHRLVGQITHEGLTIEIDIDPDDGTMAVALALAELAVRSLSDIDAKAREMLAANSLEAYNSEWRFGDEVLHDGSTSPFEKARLDKDDFCAAFQLKALEACGKNTITLWYGDNDMFWGHEFYVTSFDGLDFSDTYVSMAG